MLELHGVRVRFGGATAVDGVSFRVEEGEAVALVGGNGSGKSTLLRAISGLSELQEGRIHFRDEPIHGLPAHEIVRRGIAHAPEGNHLFPGSTVRENLLLGAWLHRGQPQVVRIGLDEVHGLFPILGERAAQRAGTLSGGEQRMLVIGRAIMTRPRLLLLDEPGLGLAPRVVIELFRAVDAIRAGGCSVVIGEQNARAALGAADRGIVLEGGRVVRTGVSASLLEDAALRRAYLGW